MWENRCKVALRGVGFAKVWRSADFPLAAQQPAPLLRREFWRIMPL